MNTSTTYIVHVGLNTNFCTVTSLISEVLLMILITIHEISSKHNTLYNIHSYMHVYTCIYRNTRVHVCVSLDWLYTHTHVYVYN